MLMVEVLEFDVFPSSERTGENIRNWLLSVLLKRALPHRAISGLCPDGAADGVCGLNGIPTLAEKMDVCDLHKL